jgi:hypothetical protein
MRILFIYEREIDMGRYDKWNELQGLKGKVAIKHLLFGEQQYGCDVLQVVNDDKKIGVVLKGRLYLCTSRSWSSSAQVGMYIR